jgi:alpha-L-fucosidase 2
MKKRKGIGIGIAHGLLAALALSSPVRAEERHAVAGHHPPARQNGNEDNGKSPAKDPPTLQIEAPIASWDEAIPLGNGLLGGLLYGGRNSTLRLSLDRGDLWDERPAPQIGSDAFTWEHWIKLVHEGAWAEVDELFTKPFSHPFPTKIPCGALNLRFDPEVRAKTISLALKDGLGRVELEGEEGKGFIECFFSALEPVALIRVSGARLVDWGFQSPSVLQEKLDFKEPEPGRTDDMRWFRQSIPEGSDYAVVGARRDGENETLIALTVTLASSDGEDPLALGKARVKDALDRGFGRLFQPHKAWWHGFSEVSDVTVPDAAVQEHYDLVRYYLGAGSRPGAPAMPLQAVWTNDNGLPQWKGDYHHDLNTQMMYVSYLTAGHFEEGRVFLDFMWNLLPAFRKFASSFYGAPGAMFPIVMTAAGNPLGGWPQYSLMPQGSAGWVGWMFYRHWKYTLDPAFLEGRAYPFCAELGTCIKALLKPDADGILVMPISSSPEIFSNDPKAYLPPSSNYDRDGLRALFDALEEMARELGLDEEARQWADISKRLGPRWTDPETGALSFAKGVPFERSHRHLSHLMSIHPYGQLNMEGSDGDRRRIENSLALLQGTGYGEWTGYTYSWASCLFARAGKADAALNFLKTYLDAFISRNGFHLNCHQKGGTGWGSKAGNPRLFTLEGNFMAMEAVHEMLLQSWGGIIRVFPAVPRAWADASFRDLRAEGGFKVSAEFKNGETTRLEIQSTRGAPMKLRSPWPEVNINGKIHQADSRGLITMDTRAGDNYRMEPSSAHGAGGPDSQSRHDHP